MKYVKIALAVCLILIMSACKTVQGVPDVVTNRPAPVAKTVIAPMELQNLRWVVRDVAGLCALADRLEASGNGSTIFYILDQDSYNALAMNISEVRRYVNDQNAANDFLAAAIDANTKTTPKPVK